MSWIRLTKAQIIDMLELQEADMPTAELCRRYGLTLAAFYKLKAQYDQME